MNSNDNKIQRQPALPATLVLVVVADHANRKYVGRTYTQSRFVLEGKPIRVYA
jgi:hypothetical protein